MPGDDTTITVVTVGTLWDIRPAAGLAVFRAVRTLVEPPDAGPTFTGHVTTGGVTMRYDDAPLEAFFSDDLFVEWVCQAVEAG